MYTFAPTSKERLSAQTALYKITDALVRLVAPILSYTADEVWSYMPKVEGRPASVHLGGICSSRRRSRRKVFGHPL